MAIRTGVRAAVTVSAAYALSQHRQKTGAMWAMSDLPRAVLHSKDNTASGCGTDVPGYYTFHGQKWDSSWKNIDTWNSTACQRACDENKHCIAFMVKKPRHGQFHCKLYKGLIQDPDHRSQSYMRCVNGFECKDGFQFTHAGTWLGGKQRDNLDDESKAECRLACFNNRACVGFTYRVSKDSHSFCSHFENEENKNGPTRDMMANTYSKCTDQFLEYTGPEFVTREAPAIRASADENQSEGLDSRDENQSEALDSRDEQSEAPDSKDEQGEAPGSKDEQGDAAPASEDEQGEPS